MNEGFTVDDFYTVHTAMVKAWQHDNKMARYIRPETLYSNKFESYLNLKEGTDLEKHSGIIEWMEEKALG